MQLENLLTYVSVCLNFIRYMGSLQVFFSLFSSINIYKICKNYFSANIIYMWASFLMNYYDKLYEII